MVHIEEVLDDPVMEVETFFVTNDSNQPLKKRIRIEASLGRAEETNDLGKMKLPYIQTVFLVQSPDSSLLHEVIHTSTSNCENGRVALEPIQTLSIAASFHDSASAKMPIQSVIKPIQVDGSTLVPKVEVPRYVESILEQAVGAIKREKKKTKWDARWIERLEELKQFRKIYGHCNVVPSHTEWKALGKWVYSQRHRRKEGVLTDEQISLLDELEFQWNLRPRKEKVWHENYFEFQCQDPPKSTVGLTWDDRFKELEDFKKENGHCNVSRYKKPWEKLGRWVYDQKRKKQKGTLADYRMKKLESLGIRW